MKHVEEFKKNLERRVENGSISLERLARECVELIRFAVKNDMDLLDPGLTMSYQIAGYYLDDKGNVTGSYQTSGPAQSLYHHFMERYSETSESLFRSVTLAALKMNVINETLETLSQESADTLKIFFKGLSQEYMVQWYESLLFEEFKHTPLYDDIRLMTEKIIKIRALNTTTKKDSCK